MSQGCGKHGTAASYDRANDRPAGAPLPAGLSFDQITSGDDVMPEGTDIKPPIAPAAPLVITGQGTSRKTWPSDTDGEAKPLWVTLGEWFVALLAVSAGSLALMAWLLENAK